MLTLLLAFINAKYKADFAFLFLFTFILDAEIISVVAQLLDKGGK